MRSIRHRLGAVICVAGLLVAASARCQTASLEMPVIGEKIPVQKFELVNRIPKSHLKRLPKELLVFRYSATPRELSVAGLQELIDLSAFKGTNIAEVLHAQTKTITATEPFRLATANNADYFSIDPVRGGIFVYNQSAGANFRSNTPPYDSIPNFDSIRDRVLHHAQMFGISTNDMERKDDGSLSLQRTDATTVARGGAVKFISRRSVGISRSIAGYTLLGSDEKVEMVLGTNGKLEQFQFKWRPMIAVHTNRLLGIKEIVEKIKSGQALANVRNEYPDEGIAKITLKDIRIQYYVPFPQRGAPVSTNINIVPIASILAEFKPKSGKSKEGVLFAPILNAE